MAERLIEIEFSCEAKEADESSHFPRIRPSETRYLREDPNEVPTPEEVKAAVLYPLAKFIDQRAIIRIKRSRKYRVNENCPLNGISKEVRWWKDSLEYFERGPNSKQALREGTHYRASQVKEIMESDEADYLEQCLLHAHEAAVNNSVYPEETSPYHTSVHDIIASYNLVLDSDSQSGLQIPVHYDHLLSDIEGRTTLVDFHPTQGDTDPSSAAIRLLFAEQTAERAMNPSGKNMNIPQKIYPHNLNTRNTTFISRDLLQANGRSQMHVGIVSHNMNIEEAVESLVKIAQIWQTRRVDVRKILKKREASFVIPHLPNSRDFDFPIQRRLF